MDIRKFLERVLPSLFEAEEVKEEPLKHAKVYLNDGDKTVVDVKYHRHCINIDSGTGHQFIKFIKFDEGKEITTFFISGFEVLKYWEKVEDETPID